MIEFSRIEALAGTKYIQAQGETKPALSAAEGGGQTGTSFGGFWP
jgi:hypothetical protein